MNGNYSTSPKKESATGRPDRDPLATQDDPAKFLTQDTFEPGGLVVEPVGSGEHEDRHAAAGGDDAFGDLVTGGPGNVSVEDGDVVGVDAQQLQSGVAVAGDVGRDRCQA
jgi:hypothetical protein